MPTSSARIFSKLSTFLLLFFLLAGCSKNYLSKGTREKKAEKKFVRTYIASLKEEPPPFDPVNTPPEKANLLSQQLEGLVKYDFQTMKALPALAIKWDVDPTFKEWTFQLRKKVYFSNGEVLTASVVKKCWARACREGKENQSVKEVFSNLRGYDEIVTGKTAELSGVEVIDDFTLKIILKNPDSAFLQKLGVPAAFIYSFSEWEKDPQLFLKKPVGSGPFVTFSWEAGKQIILKRNDYYWGKKPFLKELVFLIHKNPEQALQAFQSGAVQEVLVYPELYSRLKFDQSLVTRLRSVPLLALNYLMFNLRSSRKISKDYRGYLLSLIDAKQIASLIKKEGVRPVNSLVPLFLLETKETEELNLKKPFSKSGSFSKETRLSSGLVITFPASREYEALANKLKNDLEVQGVKVKTQLLDWPLFFEALNQGEFSLFLFSWIADYPDAEAFLKPLFYSKGEANFSFYKSPDFDELIENSAKLSGKKRAEEIKKALKLVESEQIAKPLFHYLSRWLVSNKIKRFRVNGYGWVDYSAVEFVE